VEVPIDRLTGWVERYVASHPGSELTATAGGLALAGPDGASAEIAALVPFPVEPLRGAVATPDELVAALVVHASAPVSTALVLVRRGGFAVGVASGARLTASKVGTRYVQSRTAAGGTSQQRFARRREGQAIQLLRAAARAWAELRPPEPPSVLVTGGDRALCRQLLEEPALREVRDLGIARHLDGPDPRLDVLRTAAQRAQALVVTVHEPQESPG
jgi:Actinobacteria/chloroflexi VLRF1 release factor